jgi:hypothetical protein
MIDIVVRIIGVIAPLPYGAPVLDSDDSDVGFAFDTPVSNRSQQLRSLSGDIKAFQKQIDNHHELKYLPRSVVRHSVADTYVDPAVQVSDAKVIVMNDNDGAGGGAPMLDPDTEEELSELSDFQDEPTKEQRRERKLLQKDVRSVVATRKKRKKPNDNSDLGVDVERISQPIKAKKKAKHTDEARYHRRLKMMTAPATLAMIWHTVTRCKKRACTVIASKGMIYEKAIIAATMKDAATAEQVVLDQYWQWPEDCKGMFVDGQACCRACYCAITQIKVSSSYMILW